jgi:hypothetical protein
VLRQAPPEHPWDATWAFVVTADGHRRSRLVSRSRTAAPTCVWRALGPRIGGALMAPVAAVMERKMLLGIKARAQALAADRMVGATPGSRAVMAEVP